MGYDLLQRPAGRPPRGGRGLKFVLLNGLAQLGVVALLAEGVD